MVNPYARPAIADDYPYGEPPSVEAVLRGIHLPRATLAEHPDPNGVWFLGDMGWTLDRFAEFIASAGT